MMYIFMPIAHDNGATEVNSERIYMSVCIGSSDGGHEALQCVMFDIYIFNWNYLLAIYCNHIDEPRAS